MTVSIKQDELVRVCIHGHFYQPPRENPFTGVIPREIGAEPFLNFNEKILAECYRPNAELGNFRYISFNVGPTLAEWIEKNDATTYQKIIEADRANYSEYGYGNAIAQVYNHVILPLARPGDARLQIEWGIGDFERRFGHKPEGIWLAETGVNNQVLEMLVDAGIKFVILAPWQAQHESVRTIDKDERKNLQERLRANVVRDLQQAFHHDDKLNWAAKIALERAVIPEPFDPNEPYIVPLRNGKSIIVFFYNSPLSGGVSFDQWATTDADAFAKNWILPQINADKLAHQEPQLIMIATDGELYGHHKTYRDLFLQRLLSHSLKNADLGYTFPSHWLRTHPPRRQVRIVEDTSWSCFHGVRRWSTGCDCTPGDSSWKMHLRKAFDILSEEVDRNYDRLAKRLFSNPQLALKEWMGVYNGAEKEEPFIKRNLKPQLLENYQVENWRLGRRLLLAQIYKHQMYTSCAWFFEDIDRIEPVNALAAAAMSVRLLGQYMSSHVRRNFFHELSLATSNHPRHLNGLQLYRRGVRWSLKQSRMAKQLNEIESKKIDNAQDGDEAVA